MHQSSCTDSQFQFKTERNTLKGFELQVISSAYQQQQQQQNRRIFFDVS